MTDVSPLVLARGAGLLGFLILAVGTSAGSIYSGIVIAGDAGQTTANIMASEGLFRLGIFASLTMYVLFIPYALLLFRLLRPVGDTLALLMLLFAVTGVPIAMLNQINQSAALLLLNDTAYLSDLPIDFIEAQIMLFLGLHSQGNLIGAIFWGLWLLPLGLLVYRSGCFPRILGLLLMAGCFGWLAVVIQRLVLPDLTFLAYARYVAHIAELLWILWLVVMGANVEQWRALHSSGP